jgi:sugar lactone lactonase YvrE
MHIPKLNLKMKSHHFSKLIAAILIVCFFASCSKKNNPDPNPTPPGPGGSTSPKITSLDVQQGPYNAPVVITGVNFSATASDDVVSFNGKAAKITSATATQLKVLVPLGAGTGSVSVTVGSNTASGPVFTYKLSLLVTTIAGKASNSPYADGLGLEATFIGPEGIAIDANNNLYITDLGYHTIRKMTPDGIVSTLAGNFVSTGETDGTGSSATFGVTHDVCVDSKGNLYVLESGNLRKITPAGVVTTVNGPGSPAGHVANLTLALSITIDKSDNLYITDGGIHNQIIKIDANGLVTVVAGSGARGAVDGPAGSATFNAPAGIAIDNAGNIFVTDNQTLIRKITPAGVVSTFAGGGTQYGLVNATGTNARFAQPLGLAFDKNGNLFVADMANNVIRMITPAGVVTTYAGSGIPGTFADGPASTAGFSQPKHICFDSAGIMYVTNSGNNTIRKIGMQ